MVLISVVETAESDSVSVAVDMVLSQAVAGVIVLDFDEPGRAALRALPVDVPVTVAAAAPSRTMLLPRAYLADQQGGRQATEYLLSLGHQTVHHMALPNPGRRGGRTAGWSAALGAAGIDPPAPLQTTWDPLEAHELAKILAADPAVTAVLAGNDEVAFAVLRSMAEEGRDVPGEVSVIGFDDQPIAALARPALTTVAQDFAQLGRTSFDLLARTIQGTPRPRTVSVPTHVVVRESTGPPPAHGSSTARRRRL